MLQLGFITFATSDSHCRSEAFGDMFLFDAGADLFPTTVFNTVNTQSGGRSSVRLYIFTCSFWSVGCVELNSMWSYF